jgi:hypothetical protein
MDRQEFYCFKGKALLYFVVNRELYRKGNYNMPLRLVIDGSEKRREVVRTCYEDLGHKGKESTYRRVSTGFFWEGYYADCKAYVFSCVSC